jgi:epoxyqueuosine reductase
MTDQNHLSAFVKHAAAAAGFDLAGVAPVREFSELQYFPEWIARGHAGEMQYLTARNESGELKRASLSSAAPWARSVVVCAMNYNTSQPCSTHGSGGSGKGWISRYAWGAEDYHQAVLRRLRQVETQLREYAGEAAETRSYVDTGPIVERVYARYAGIGWIGKNTCIINQQMGSWLFLGVILTSLQIEPDLPAPDRCGSCTRCIDVCPTDAFLEPHKLDATRCISYLTIEKRGGIPEEIRPALGRHVFGCDLCQDVCPWNRRAPANAVPELQARQELVNPALEWLAAVDESGFREVFRKSPVKRAKYSGLRRNIAVAMGNSGDPGFLPELARMEQDLDPIVAEHARWAIARLKEEKLKHHGNTEDANRTTR